ncbi:hypothetical protein SPF06_01120 [Sinomonas sp. JGH33]|uniref:DUF1906 domain-containing protein n=1 Tax=Sinomonas terricola TaxID=3110330 RepID=A0ABU5T1A6_9MICC|nr:hypothetical protein [Sinomonas sp. JGH33]MEA5453312.1 hypothetical protein [Sinomonas sp. JGH33]
MTLKVGDYAKDSGRAPDFGDDDAVILNCTPQNYNFRFQLAKAVSEGRLIGYYTWPFAYGGNGTQDGANCAAALANCPHGPVFWDVEQGSYGGANPVTEGLAFIRAVQAAGRGAHDYIMGSLVAGYDFSSHVQAGAGLWVAQYNAALTVNLGAWSQVGPIGWQWGGTGTAPGGGDASTFFLDRADWAAISVPPGVNPDSGNVTPIGGFMALSDSEQTELLAHARNINNETDALVQRTNDLAEVVENVRKLVYGQADLAAMVQNLTPAQVAAAIPADIAKAVADELAKRLAATP